MLPAVDLVLTDPPYGVGFRYQSYDDTLDAWKLLMSMLVSWAKQNADMAILPSCQIKQLPWIYGSLPPDWLICWYKGSPGHSAWVGFNDWEPLLVYGKPKGLQIHDYFYAQPEPVSPNGHPCPKPLRWATHLIGRTTKEGATVLDACVGSGTTLVAAKSLNRRAIGIEIELKYVQIAASRLRQEVLQFADPPAP